MSDGKPSKIAPKPTETDTPSLGKGGDHGAVAVPDKKELAYESDKSKLYLQLTERLTKIEISERTKRNKINDDIKKLRAANLTFTTYAIMRNEIERLQEEELKYVILDESQNIKKVMES